MKASTYLVVLLIAPLMIGVICELIIAKRKSRGVEIESALIIACVLAVLSVVGSWGKLKKDILGGEVAVATDQRPYKVKFIELPDKDFAGFGFEPRQAIESTTDPVTQTRLGENILYSQVATVDDLGALMMKRGVASASQTVAAKEFCNLHWKDQARIFGEISFRSEVVNHGQFGEVFGCHLQLSIGTKLIDGVALAEHHGNSLYQVVLVPASQGAR